MLWVQVKARSSKKTKTSAAKGEKEKITHQWSEETYEVAPKYHSSLLDQEISEDY